MADKSQKRPKPEDFAFDLEEVFASMVSLRTHIPPDAFTAPVLGTERSGHGVVIREDGLILTIGYLVTEADEVWITDYEGRATRGHVLAYDQECGLGLIQPLGHIQLKAMEIGNSADVRKGDPVLVVGFGGIKSSICAEVSGVREFAGYWEYLLEEAIFTSPAHPNWGGTAVVGQRGELLGIGSLFIQNDKTIPAVISGPDGNMVVPIDLLSAIIDELLEHGQLNREPRPWLGLFGTEQEGKVIVAALTEDGPADIADVEVGDIIVSVDGTPVDSLANFFRYCWRIGPAGVSVPITVERGVSTLNLDIPTIARADLLKAPQLH